MSAYRSSARVEIPRVVYGNRKKSIRAIMLGVGLIFATIAAVTSWFFDRYAGISGNVVVPAIFGFFLVVRASWGELSLHRDRDVLAVKRRGVFPKSIEVPVGDIETVRLDVSRKKRSAVTLNLYLRGGRTVFLEKSDELSKLEPSHRAIADFLVEHDLLFGGQKARAANPEVRVAAPPMRVDVTEPEAAPFREITETPENKAKLNR